MFLFNYKLSEQTKYSGINKFVSKKVNMFRVASCDGMQQNLNDLADELCHIYHILSRTFSY